MADNERLNALEKRLQQITQTLINAQIELSNVKKEIESVRTGQVPVKETPPAVTPAPQVTPQAQAKKLTEEPKPSPTPPPPKPKAKTGFEEFVGGKVLTYVGIGILVIGLGIFVKYAIDQDLIGPVGRVTLGLMAGAALLGLAFRLKTNYHVFSAVLLSGGMADLYFTTYAAYDFYSLIPQAAAFAVMVVLTAFTVFAAIMYNLQLIAILGLVGGYLVPFLLSDRSGRVLILFSYTTLLNAGVLVVAFRKYWRTLHWFAFVITWLIYGAWFADRYDHAQHFLLATVFGTVFFVLFHTMISAYKLLKREPFGIQDVILVVANSFLFYGFAYAIFEREQDGLFLGLMTLVYAFVHFLYSYASYRTKLADRRFFYLEIGMVLTFIVIAVPVQLDGNWVTMVWSIGALLLFAIGRTQRVLFYERLGYVLIVLAGISLMDDWDAYSSESHVSAMLPLVNTTFLSSFVYLLSLGGVLYVGRKEKFLYDEVRASRIQSYFVYSLVGVFVLALYLSLAFEIDAYWDRAYYASVIQVEYPVWNYDLRTFASVWWGVYTGLFLAAAAALVRRNWPWAVPVWLVFGFSALYALFFWLGMLSDLHFLLIAFASSDPERYFPVDPSYVYVRYVVFAAAVLLLVVTQRLLLSAANPVARYFPIVTHVTIIAILSAELTAWMVLTHTSELREYEELSFRVGYTILWGLYSLGLIAYGIWKRRKVLRLLAIGLFAVTLTKLYLVDLGDISTGGKIIVFLSLGVLLLLVAFLYQKFKTIIFQSDETNT